MATATWRARAFSKLGGGFAVVVSESPVCWLSADVGKWASSVCAEAAGAPGLVVGNGNNAVGSGGTGARRCSNRWSRRLARAVNGILGVAVLDPFVFPSNNICSSSGSIITEKGVTCSQG